MAFFKVSFTSIHFHHLPRQLIGAAMATSRPYVTSEGPRFRRFAAFPVAVQAILVNSDERFLLLFNPVGDQGWQVVSGALEAGETLLEGTLREVREELGPGSGSSRWEPSIWSHSITIPGSNLCWAVIICSIIRAAQSFPGMICAPAPFAGGPCQNCRPKRYNFIPLPNCECSSGRSPYTAYGEGRRCPLCSQRSKGGREPILFELHKGVYPWRK
jgi:hypothetical protein